jgi:hypothetical protein
MRCDKTGTIVPFLMRAAATMLAGAVFLLPVSGQTKHSAPAKPAAKPAAGQSSAELRDAKPRLIFTSYDPATDTTSPVMTRR